MTPKKVHHYCEGKEIGRNLPNQFAILCWNLNKFSDDKTLAKALRSWEATWPLKLLFLQEARFDTICASLQQRYEVYGGANLRYFGNYYGVMSASRTEAIYAKALHSRGREVLIGPKKPFLVTEYPLENSQRLLCLNLHAINFREERRYRLELEYIEEKLIRHKGPMLVAGDFNRWNDSRKKRMDGFKKSLGLEQLPTGSKHLKSFMGHPLDFVLYRNLHLKRYTVVNHEISDHNPILAEFTI